jgi:hypothetical protein
MKKDRYSGSIERVEGAAVSLVLTLPLQPILNIEDLCAQIRTLSVDIQLISKRMYQMLERNKEWLTRIPLLSWSLWVFY